MTFNDFSKEILSKIEERIWPEEEVSFKKIRKNNDIVLSGVVIKERSKNIGPTVYIDDFYKKYKRCEKYTIDLIVSEILKIARNNRVAFDFDIRSYEVYENNKNNMYFRMLNKEMNLNFLQDLPYKEFLDLALVVYCDLTKSFGNGASIIVNNEQLKMWGIDKATLFEDARRNTFCENRVYLFNYGEYLENKAKNDSEEPLLLDDEIIELAKEWHVLSNIDYKNGAVNFANTHLLDDFCDEYGDTIMILPSSVNEVILIPVKAGERERISGIDDLVCIINDTVLNKNEILSNHAYFYSKERGYFY